ncbi:cytochrome b561 domain-containing protein [Agrobacterium salinitolerans]|uniref:cytochrome b561 domain-containing protein n=1 Tax=Agrobacterium salinitolerans TaxID=1183413 RepID=UPI0015726687|nr:cytochrome b561 domain-containing protein [Agrobacterium salinitolerans]NTA40242.1 hypothetical protein [Agrobacterium salinitolerans]
MDVSIPQTYLSPFGWEIDIHWNYHAILMFSVWGVCVPAILFLTRFAKPAPTLNGSMSRPQEPLIWFNFHKYGLYCCMSASIGGGLLAVIVSNGVSGSIHSFLGIATVVFGALQLVIAAMRGSRGGKFAPGVNLDDPLTWRGDHYDMTPRRLWFEAAHKTVGYATLFSATGAIATGLAQYWMIEIGIMAATVFVTGVIAAIVFEGLGKRHDTYQSYYGNHPDHPHNKSKLVTLADEQT